MNGFKKNFCTVLLVLFFLNLALFVFPITAQQIASIIKPDKTLDLSVPSRLCFQNQNNKIAPLNIASDNNSAIFAVFQSGKIEKINLPDNTIIWKSDLGGQIASDLIFENGRLFLITKVLKVASGKNYSERDYEGNDQIINYILWSLDAETGLTDWQFSFISKTSVSMDAYLDKIFLIGKNGIVNSTKKSNAQQILNKNLAQYFSSPPSFFENRIYIGTEDNFILIVSADNVEIISKIPTRQSPASILIAAKDKIIWGERNGFVNLVDTKNNNLVWNVRYGGEISSLTLVPGGLLVSSLDNFVYLISLQKGKRIWKRRLSGRISAKPLIVNNLAVFVTAVDNHAVVLNLNNGKIVNQISLSDIGFTLSRPVIAGNSLVFSTNKGIFAFSSANAKCF